jgi:hypothetical protein
MNGKGKAAFGDAAGVWGHRALGQAPFSRVTIARNTRAVKSRYDQKLSRALDRTIVGVESSRGIARAVWRIRKRWLESKIGE